MAKPLIERNAALAEMRASLDRVLGGSGEVLLISGEAGAGKTSVIREFVTRVSEGAVVLVGSCDPLTTPRPFGPLIDAAHSADVSLAHKIAGSASRAEVFEAALLLVDGRRYDANAAIFVIEDAHWADDATLDLITFLGRRIKSVPTLFVISYRDDEVGATHPLRARFGELADGIRTRLHLDMLSIDGVAQIADGTDLDPNELHRTTLGNPFYVTEIVGAGADRIPQSIHDAVIARAGRLDVSARWVLDAAAIVPGRTEPWLLALIAAGTDVPAGLQTCRDRGLLSLDEAGCVMYRHEMARTAVLEALSATQRCEFHARALAALTGHGVNRVDVARLAYHAVESDDPHSVLRYTPVAAAEASAVGSHTAALGHLKAAVRHARELPPRQRAELLVRVGQEETTLSRWEDAIASFDNAGLLYVQIGDVEKQAETMVLCDRPLWGLGRQREALVMVEEAARLVSRTPRSRSAALVATSLSTAQMLERRFDAAELAGVRAIAAAEQIGDLTILAEACIVSGISAAMSGDDAGLSRVKKGIDIASDAGNDALVALGHLQIGSGYGELREYATAMPALLEGIAFAEEREIVWAVHYMRAWLARCHLERGDWQEATALANELVQSQRCAGNSRYVALLTLGWLRGRRGDPGAGVLLDEALGLARETGHVQRLWPIAACRAELAWLCGQLDAEVDLVREVRALGAELRYQRVVEELDHWLSIAAGGDLEQPAGAQTPFGLSAAGQHILAASWWQQVGCPYEEANARFASGRADELLVAFEAFRRLGAAPMQKRAATAMKALGVPVPRGPIRSTRENPHKLTDREVDVLALIATGRTNRAIAAALGISVKTVDHHVSHVLTKLDVQSRSQAAVLAERIGLTAPAEDTPT